MVVSKRGALRVLSFFCIYDNPERRPTRAWVFAFTEKMCRYTSPRQGSLDKQRLSSELDKLFIHSKETARTRAQTARQTATELQKEVEQLQEERSRQHNSLKMLSASKTDRQKELRGINNAIRQKQRELEAIRKDVEEVKGFLSEAQQNRLTEINREWNDAERE